MRLIQAKALLLICTFATHLVYGSGLNARDDTNDASLRSMAADADLNFFLAFISNFEQDLTQYKTFMAKNHITLPQAVANYYYRLITLPQTADLEADIASTFPFTDFKTFITAFPWYSSLLSDASASTIYLPEDFQTLQVTTSITGSISSSGSPSIVSPSPTSALSSVSSTMHSITSPSTSQPLSSSSATFRNTSSTSTSASLDKSKSLGGQLNLNLLLVIIGFLTTVL